MLVNDDDMARITNAVVVLIDESEEQGRPVTALDTARSDQNFYRCVVAMTGRQRDVDELIHLMQQKYPNAEIPDIEDVLRERGQVSPHRSGERGEA